ncbi:hypothetical protein [Actinophytocola gossypii]|uniref:Uncharacterized protein n=1 Tax=Actinophytocola gossypii TaxID=2812003 RepID=A0ABT2JAR4_9PSEU|nr:hypothetical protein [Actinophytocola gossypii]MCT2584957.1 hypothetical protein [Actinophytocola gossypii]
MLSVVAFGVAWWLGLYLLARDPTKPILRRAGAGLLSYGLALALDVLRPHGTVLSIAHVVLLGLPAVLWAGVLLGLRARETRTRRGDVLVGALLVGLAGGLVLLGTVGEPRVVLLAAIGVDLVALGVCVAVFDSFDEGETLRRDMLGSLLLAGTTAVLFGGQVGLAILLAGDRTGLTLLLYGVVAAAIAVQVLARPIQRAADRLALPEPLRARRTELREAADALPRRDETIALAGLTEAEFVRLTRLALRHYGDLGKLVASPLTALPAIDARLAARGAPDAPLERATELKALLLDTIVRLKPRDGEFGTSEEWRHYNALYFYYVAGVRPYSVRTKLTEIDPTARRALSWFADHVPERTLHNWQAAAARLVAEDLRAGLPADLR